MPPDKAAEQFAESIKPILDRADALGVNVGIECEPGLFLEYVAELREWIDRLGHPRFGANLDIGHSVGDRRRRSPTRSRLLAGRIWNLHVEDLPGRKHYHMIPGEGTLDWAALQRRPAEDRIRPLPHRRTLHPHRAPPGGGGEELPVPQQVLRHMNDGNPHDIDRHPLHQARLPPLRAGGRRPSPRLRRRGRSPWSVRNILDDPLISTGTSTRSPSLP